MLLSRRVAAVVAASAPFVPIIHGQTTSVECVFSQFAAPVTVDTQACCDAIVEWIGAGTDSEMAGPILQETICPDTSCSSSALSIFEATPPGLVIDPGCEEEGESKAEEEEAPEEVSSEGFSCKYSAFSDPMAVSSEACCVQLQDWLDTGLEDLDRAANALNLICQEETDTPPGVASCADAVQDIYRATPAFIQQTLMEPKCDEVEQVEGATVVDFDCNIQDIASVSNMNVPGEACCSHIQQWMASASKKDDTSWKMVNDICSYGEAVTSLSQSCLDVAASIYDSVSVSKDMEELPLPICEIPVYILQADFGNMAMDAMDASHLGSVNHKCLEGSISRELYNPAAIWMKRGNCSDVGFSVESPGSDAVNMMDTGFHFFTDAIVAHSFEVAAPHCAEVRMQELMVVGGMHVGSCAAQGYQRPAGTRTTPFGELHLFGPGIDAPPMRYVHKIGFPEEGKCGERKVLLTDVDQLVAEEGYKLHSCARSNYFLSDGVSQDNSNFTLWSLPPAEPRVLDYDWDFSSWTLDFMRGKPVGQTRKSPLDIPYTQRRNSLLFGGHYPGPLLEAIEDDTIHVKLANKAAFGETTTVHWHGLHMRDTPFADGAQLISQMPLPPYESMQYSFKADPPGTHFYHSHIPLQRSMGAMGPILIHSREDPHRHLYDEDRIVFVADEVREPRMLCEGDDESDYLLGTGQGHRTYVACSPEAAAYRHSFNGEVGNGTSSYPYHLIPVEEGKCYRLRFTLASAESVYLVVKLGGHNMTVIAVDGTPIEPMEVESFHLQQGARVDAVVCADAEPGMYDLSVTDDLACALKDIGLFDECTFHSFLSYDTFDGPPPSHPPVPEGPIPGVGGGRSVATTSNGINLDLDSPESYKSVTPVEDSRVDISIEPYRVHLEFGKLADPYVSADQPLLTAHRWYLSETKTTWHYPANGGIPLMQDPSCYDPEKTPVMEIPDDVEEVEILVDNLTPMSHNLHIHGMRAKVINVGKYDFAYRTGQFSKSYNDTEFSALCEAQGGTVKLSAPDEAPDLQNVDSKFWGCSYNESSYAASHNYDTPLERDVFNVPRRGWLLVRFKTDNPGVWPFHCHVADHAMGGAMTAFSIKPSLIPEAPADFGPKRSCLLASSKEDGEHDSEAVASKQLRGSP